MVLGIDLGTSNTVAATLSRDNVPIIVPDYNNKELQSTPSSVLIDGSKAYAGAFAENLFEYYPNKLLHKFFKRNFGTQKPIFIDENKNPWFSETLAAMVLKKVENDATYFMSGRYTNLVITVPAHYNDLQRKSIIEASKLANMNLTAIIDEPIAAALSYAQSSNNINEEIIMVYDFGGGTFDLTFLTKSSNKLHVIAKDGISDLGGKEFDEIVMNIIKDAYQQVSHNTFPNDALSENKLKRIAERIKIKLNSKGQNSFEEWLYFNKTIFKVYFDKNDYAEKAFRLVTKTEEVINRCLRSLGLRFEDINKLIFIGGTSNSSLIYDFWQEKIQLGKQSILYHQPLSSVAKGAAIYANSLSGNSANPESTIQLETVSTYCLGLKWPDGKLDTFFLRNSPLPCSGKKVYRLDPRVSPNLSFSLNQYWDESSEMQDMGIIIIPNPQGNTNPINIEISLENRVNGTIAVKVKQAETGKDIRFDFMKKNQQYEYSHDQQVKLLSDITLNTIF